VNFSFITILFIHPKILSFFFTERIHKYTDDRAQKVRTKRLIIIAKNILIASACAIRIPADTIRMSANILIVFSPILIMLKNKHIQI